MTWVNPAGDSPNTSVLEEAQQLQGEIKEREKWFMLV